jgi:hypothetical protein
LPSTRLGPASTSLGAHTVHEGEREHSSTVAKSDLTVAGSLDSTAALVHDEGQQALSSTRFLDAAARPQATV